MTTPTLGRIVNYTTATGNIVTAQVVCTPDSYSPGRYVNRMTPEERREELAGVTRRSSIAGGDGALDNDGDEWIPSPVPAPKPDRVHLKITAPNGNTYVEFNVAEDDDAPTEPDTPGTIGTYHFPPQVVAQVAPAED